MCNNRSEGGQFGGVFVNFANDAARFGCPSLYSWLKKTQYNTVFEEYILFFNNGITSKNYTKQVKIYSITLTYYHT